MFSKDRSLGHNAQKTSPKRTSDFRKYYKLIFLIFYSEVKTECLNPELAYITLIFES